MRRLLVITWAKAINRPSTFARARVALGGIATWPRSVRTARRLASLATAYGFAKLGEQTLATIIAAPPILVRTASPAILMNTGPPPTAKPTFGSGGPPSTCHAGLAVSRWK